MYFYPEANGSIGSIGINGNRYYYVRNAQNDIIGITDKTGAFVARYTYDEWGVITSITDGNGIDVSANPNHIANINPLRYRSYFYDTETGWYWLNTRYYNPEVGRFVNADGYVSTGQDITGFNMFAYCGNNPINRMDPNGAFWKEIGKGICNFFVNIGEAFLSSIEAEVGIGFGLGVDVSHNFTAEISRDTYVGIDDGEITTGNVITAELSLFDFLAIGRSYNHLVEKGGIRVSNSGSALDGPLDMIDYPDVAKGNAFTLGFISKNDSGQWLLSASASAHCGPGGHVSISLNLSEFVERVFD